MTWHNNVFVEIMGHAQLSNKFIMNMHDDCQSTNQIPRYICIWIIKFEKIFMMYFENLFSKFFGIDGLVV
jgi:hypothetical protein